MKINEHVVREYVRRVNDDDLRFFQTRFSQCLCGDRAEIADKVSLHREMDKLFASAQSPDDLFDLYDTMGEFVKKEYVRRFGKE